MPQSSDNDESIDVYARELGGDIEYNETMG